MKLNEVEEIGFYKAVKDEKPNYIFEVIKNTDEEWLKDNPQATLLIDEWGYEYTDDDDRRHYETFGSLTSIQNADEIEVEKMTENFIVSGQAGNHLTEDKPTYKEKYQKLIKINHELAEEHKTIGQDLYAEIKNYRKEKENLKEENEILRKFLNQYQEEANALKSYETYKVWLNNEYRKENEKLKQYLLNIAMIIEEFEQQYDDIKDFTEIKEIKEILNEVQQ